MKRFIKVLVLFVFILAGGPTTIYANTAPEKDCTFVSECIGQKDDQESPQQKEGGSTETSATDVSSVGTTFKVLFALVFVITLLVLVLKFLHKRTQVIQQSKGIQTLGGAMLGNQRSVQLIKVGNRVLLVGVGDNVELIKEIDDPNEVEALLDSNRGHQTAQAQAQGVLGWIHSLKSNNQSDSSNFKQILTRQLKDSKQKRNTMLDALKKEKDND